MEKGSDGLRERLLARLPKTEKLANYREETAVLLAKHEKAIWWDKWSFKILSYCAVALWILCASTWGQTLAHRASVGLWSAFGFALIGAMSTGLQYFINRSKVDILKEVKQVQLQVLELQASLRKDGAL
jgi:hypothetical protein